MWVPRTHLGKLFGASKFSYSFSSFFWWTDNTYFIKSQTLFVWRVKLTNTSSLRPTVPFQLSFDDGLFLLSFLFSLQCPAPSNDGLGSRVNYFVLFFPSSSNLPFGPISLSFSLRPFFFLLEVCPAFLEGGARKGKTNNVENRRWTVRKICVNSWFFKWGDGLESGGLAWMRLRIVMKKYMGEVFSCKVILAAFSHWIMPSSLYEPVLFLIISGQENQKDRLQYIFPNPLSPNSTIRKAFFPTAIFPILLS